MPIFNSLSSYCFFASPCNYHKESLYKSECINGVEIVFTFFKFLCFFISVSPCHSLYSATLGETNHDYAGMQCDALMLGLIKESSYNKTFSDKKLALVFGFERHDNKIGITFSHKVIGSVNNEVYANFQLDLVSQKLLYIDPEPSIEININKDYLPYIAEKCTPEENIYVNIAKLPD
jgi:hypothetical protein